MTSTSQGVPNRWNRWSMTIDDNRWQSMPINRLILIIDEQSIVQVCVIIDCHRLSISIDQLASIVIDYQYQSINWHRLSSIININRLIGIDSLTIFIYWLLLLFSVMISKGRVSWCILMTKTMTSLAEDRGFCTTWQIISLILLNSVNWIKLYSCIAYTCVLSFRISRPFLWFVLDESYNNLILLKKKTINLNFETQTSRT